jgi:hypothetical protein
MLWLQLFSVLLLALLGTIGGLRFGRSNGRLWWIGFLVPFLCIALVLIGHRSHRLAFTPPISWITDVTVGPLLMAAAISMLFATLIARLPRPRRRMVWLLLAVMLLAHALLPVIAPLAVRSSLARARTRFDTHGVCLQTTPYTCGPAAAVTCLRQLGITAREGLLAIDARCGPFVGTDERFLAQTVSRNFPTISVDCRYVESLDDLAVPAVVVTWQRSVGGHFIAVLRVSADDVTIGDPLAGLQHLSRADFLAIWQHASISFHR